jgi:hypothetical protein
MRSFVRKYTVYGLTGGQGRCRCGSSGSMSRILACPNGRASIGISRLGEGRVQEVYGGCNICGRRMLTDRSPLERRTCDACKAIQRREYNRRADARRKAERDAVKAKIAPPRCEKCGKPIEGANLLATRAGPQWARKFCSNTCRQAAFRARARASLAYNDNEAT